MGSKNKIWRDRKTIVHGNSSDAIQVLTYWNRSDYNRIIKRFERVANRMTLRKAIGNAARRAADTGVTSVIKNLAQLTTLRSKEIRRRVKAYGNGSQLGMAYGVKLSDTARPMSDFNFTPKKWKYRTAPVVEVHRGKKETLDKGAFVAKVAAGGKSHTGIFEREAEKRKNIKSKEKKGSEWIRIMDEDSVEHIHLRSFPGPSVTGLFKANEDIHKKVWAAINETLEKRIEHELDRLLKGKRR